MGSAATAPICAQHATATYTALPASATLLSATQPACATKDTTYMVPAVLLAHLSVPPAPTPPSVPTALLDTKCTMEPAVRLAIGGITRSARPALPGAGIVSPCLPVLPVPRASSLLAESVSAILPLTSVMETVLSVSAPVLPVPTRLTVLLALIHFSYPTGFVTVHPTSCLQEEGVRPVVRAAPAVFPVLSVPPAMKHTS